MRNLTFLSLAASVSLLVWAPARAQESGRSDGMRFVPDVVGQFAALSMRPDALGFHIGASPDPSTCRHYQGIVRVDAADGTPYFLVTRSGNRPADVPAGGCDASPGENGQGNLIVVRMGSRDKNGERLRSNRLKAGQDIRHTSPPPEDTVVAHLEFDGTSLPHYGHPGGMQAVGHMLAMTVEHPYGPALPRAAVLFFDVTNPEVPVLRSWFSTEAQMGDTAGVVGITPIRNDRYLMVVAGGKNETLFFYRSTTSDLSSTSLSWEFVGRTPGPIVEDPHQTLHFLQQSHIFGRLYLAGARGRILSPDRIDLYHVWCETLDCAPGDQVSWRADIKDQHISSFAGGQRLANLAAASGFYVSPSGELVLYATEHDNDGPGGTVKAAEWRHVEMVRKDSPTLRPQVTVGGPYTVDEGGQVELTGVGRSPITKSWIQLYSDVNFGGHSVVVDYDDRELDDFSYLPRLDDTLPSNRGFSNNTASWRWFAPPGCSIRATDLDGAGWHAKRTLTNTGADADLRGVLDDRGQRNMFQIIDSIQFFSCEAYYDGPFTLHWDFDRDGFHETTGNSIPFAPVVDGPAVLQIPVEARHHLGGPRPAWWDSPGQATVVVRNVAPRVTALRLFNSTGRQIYAHTFAGTVASVLAYLPITVEADFFDPGIKDHQSAAINWGDAVVDPHTIFRTYDDAFADTTGTLSHAHRYTSAGLRSIRITVRDDDGGAGSKTIQLNVIGPAQAVERVVAELDLIIAATSDDTALRHLMEARQALAGRDSRTIGGALYMIRAGYDAAAIDLLNQAIASLQNAQIARVDRVIMALEEVIASLSAKTKLGA